MCLVLRFRLVWLIITCVNFTITGVENEIKEVKQQIKDVEQEINTLHACQYIGASCSKS